MASIQQEPDDLEDQMDINLVSVHICGRITPCVTVFWESAALRCIVGYNLKLSWVAEYIPASPDVVFIHFLEKK